MYMYCHSLLHKIFPFCRYDNTPLANTLYYRVGEMEGDSPSILQVEGAVKRKAEENVLFRCSYTFNTPIYPVQ